MTELVIDIGRQTVEATRPQIDLDVEVHSPSLDISVPGPRGVDGRTILSGSGAPADDFPLLMPLDGVNDPWRWSPRGTVWFGPAFEVTWDDGDALDNDTPVEPPWIAANWQVHIVVTTAPTISGYIVDFAGIEVDASVSDTTTDAVMSGAGSGYAFLWQFDITQSGNEPYDLQFFPDVGDYLGDLVLGAPYEWPDADTVPTPVGKEGDYYIDTDTLGTTDMLYGPKTSGVWGNPVSLVGPPGPTGEPGNSDQVFVMLGGVAPKIGTVGFYPRVAGQITRVTAALSDQLSGVTRVDVNIGGVTVFSNQANRPNLNSTGRHFDDADAIDAGAFTATDYITCDIDSAGTGAKDLIVTVEYEPTP